MQEDVAVVGRLVAFSKYVGLSGIKGAKLLKVCRDI